MSTRPMPTQVERFLGDDDFIVSKTDLQGRILYGNRSFIELSGYTEAELLGEPHNIIRHPDMPRGVFKLLWDTIQGGHEVWAYVKNLSRDGGFYWVLANVTPSYDEADTLVGYYSVRRKPEPRCIKTIGGIYQSMLAREQGRSAREAAELSLQFLNEVLASKGISYEEFVLSL